MKIDTIGALAAQPATHDKTHHEWANLIETAEAAGLLRPEDSTKVQDLKGRYAMGLLPPDKAQREAVALLAAGPAPDKALDAIAPLFAKDDVIELRALPDAMSYNGRLSVHVERAEMEAFIRRYIGQANLYFGANPRVNECAKINKSGNAADVAKRRAMFLDLDLKDAPDADPGWTQTVAELEAYGAALVVQTGNGYHVWLTHEPLDGEALPASVAPLAAVMARIGSDNVADLPRIARLPFTVNLPNAAKRQRGNTVALSLPVSSTAATPLFEVPAPNVEALCVAVEAVADRLRLPGRAGASGSSASTTDSGGGEKKGWAAPSAKLLRMALEELPNDHGLFDDRFDWVSVCAAAKGAAVEGGFEDAGREVWLDFCKDWSAGGNAEEDARVWDTMNAPRNGWGSLMKWLEQANPAGAQRVKDAKLQAAFPPLPASFCLQSVEPYDPKKDPPRKWLYGRSVFAGFVSMLTAPGGHGKSALAMVEAVAMASGKTLLPGDNPHHELRVWYHNAEDDMAEQRRRWAATMHHHGVSHSDLGGRLILTSGRDLPVKLAQQGAGGSTINRDAVEWLVKELTDARIDVLILDPLGAMHTLPENDNTAANVLYDALREIATRSGAAIILVHHAGKVAAKDMEAAGASAARGASAFVDGARDVRQLGRPNKNQHIPGISAEDRWRYLRVDNGKANLAPQSAARWVRLVSVKLGNGTADYPDGDSVQTVESWTLPTAAGATTSDLHAVQTAIQGAHDAGTAPAKNVQSPDWVGHVVGATLGINVGAPGTKKEELNADEGEGRARVRALVNRWLAEGALLEYVAPGKGRRPQTFIKIGAPAIVTDIDDESELPSAA